MSFSDIIMLFCKYLVKRAIQLFPARFHLLSASVDLFLVLLKPRIRSHFYEPLNNYNNNNRSKEIAIEKAAEVIVWAVIQNKRVQK